MNKSNPRMEIITNNIKLTNPSVAYKTPVNNSNRGLTERIMNVVSPATNRSHKYANTQRKVVSIDLKISRKPSTQQSLNKDNPKNTQKPKKIIKMRKKTQSVDKISTLASSYRQHICLSQRTLKASKSTNILNHKLHYFDDITSPYTHPSQNPSKKKQQNWQQIIQNKKQHLYSKIYKIDKQMYILEQQIDSIMIQNNKRHIMDILKKKIVKQKQNNITPIQIHTNIYLAKKRAA